MPYFRWKDSVVKQIMIEDTGYQECPVCEGLFDVSKMLDGAADYEGQKLCSSCHKRTEPGSFEILLSIVDNAMKQYGLRLEKPGIDGIALWKDYELTWDSWDGITKATLNFAVPGHGNLMRQIVDEHGDDIAVQAIQAAGEKGFLLTFGWLCTAPVPLAWEFML